MSVWTIEDVTAGRCELEDLGEQRPQEPAQEPLPRGEFDPALSVADQMELHFRQELHRLGPDEFYKAHPTYVHRVLLKRVAPAIAQPSTTPAGIARSYPPSLVDQALEHLMTTGEFPPHMLRNRWLPAKSANDPVHPLTRALIGPPSGSSAPGSDDE